MLHGQLFDSPILFSLFVPIKSQLKQLDKVLPLQDKQE